MTLINCPGCGAQVSDQSHVCTECGCPLNAEKGELIIYGLTQSFLIGGTLKVFLDGELVAKVHKREKVTLPITHICELSICCGSNPNKSQKIVFPNRTTRIQVVYNRLSGNFTLRELD